MFFRMRRLGAIDFFLGGRVGGQALDVFEQDLLRVVDGLVRLELRKCHREPGSCMSSALMLAETAFLVSTSAL